MGEDFWAKVAGGIDDGQKPRQRRGQTYLSRDQVRENRHSHEKPWTFPERKKWRDQNAGAPVLHPPPPKPHPRGGTGVLPVQRYVAPPAVSPSLPPFGRGIRRPCPALTAEELTHLIEVLGSRSRRQWHGSSLVAALIAFLVGTGAAAPKVLEIPTQDVPLFRLPPLLKDAVDAWARRRKKSQRPGPWLFCTAAGDRLLLSDVRNRLARASRVLDRRISVSGLRKTHELVRTGALGRFIPLE